MARYYHCCFPELLMTKFYCGHLLLPVDYRDLTPVLQVSYIISFLYDTLKSVKVAEVMTFIIN